MRLPSLLGRDLLRCGLTATLLTCSQTSCEPCLDCDLDGSFWEDCDDHNPEVNPNATEVCNDVDDDCDKDIDNILQPGSADEIWYPDLDHDDYGNGSAPQFACKPVENYVNDSTDCDDTLDTTFPGAQEVCDYSDNDCDTAIDEDVSRTVFQDEDQDGYGDDEQAIQVCEDRTGYVDVAGDCDDSSHTIHPDATEPCDGIDNDCDELIDEVVAMTLYQDQDGDGYGDPNLPLYVCDGMSGYVNVGGDCDDASVLIHPGAVEICDELDEDCDGVEDSGTVSTGGFNFDSIQAAIDDSPDGSIILVCGGTPEPFEIVGRAEITIQGIATAEGLPLVVASPAAAIQVTSESSRILVSGFQISKAGSNGIKVANSTKVTMEDMAISQSGDTGIIVSSSPDTVLSNLEVYANTKGGNGGGVHIQESVATIQDCIIRDNSSGEGGGIYLSAPVDSEGSTLTVTGTTISGNQASNKGGGIYVRGKSFLELMDSSILDTVQEHGLYIRDDANGMAIQVQIRTSTLSNNTAYDVRFCTGLAYTIGSEVQDAACSAADRSCVGLEEYQLTDLNSSCP